MLNAAFQNMFHIIGYIIFGLIVGLVARFLMPGRDHMSLPITTGLGILGSVLAGWLGRAVGWYGPNDNAGFFLSIAGAIILLAIYHFAMRGRSSRTSVTNRNDRDFPRKAA